MRIFFQSWILTLGIVLMAFCASAQNVHISILNPPPELGANQSLLDLANNFELPEPADTDSENLELWATYYNLHQANAVTNGDSLLNTKGIPLGPKLTKRDWCFAAMEGSVRVSFNGIERTYNFAGSSGQQVNCSEFFPHRVGGSRFRIAKGPFGDGVRNYILVPFRTIAVDPKKIPYGSLVYIPDARGTEVTLLDGRTVRHDGYFFAGDTGGAIKKNHIDVFIGPATSNPFSWVTSSASRTFEARISKNDEISAVLNTLHTEK